MRDRVFLCHSQDPEDLPWLGRLRQILAPLHRDGLQVFDAGRILAGTEIAPADQDGIDGSCPGSSPGPRRED